MSTKKLQTKTKKIDFKSLPWFPLEDNCCCSCGILSLSVLKQVPINLDLRPNLDLLPFIFPFTTYQPHPRQSPSQNYFFYKNSLISCCNKKAKPMNDKKGLELVWAHSHLKRVARKGKGFLRDKQRHNQ